MNSNQSTLGISPTVSSILVNAADDDRYGGRDGSASTFRYLTCLNLLHDWGGKYVTCYVWLAPRSPWAWGFQKNESYDTSRPLSPCSVSEAVNLCFYDWPFFSWRVHLPVPTTPWRQAPPHFPLFPSTSSHCISYLFIHTQFFLPNIPPDSSTSIIQAVCPLSLFYYNGVHKAFSSPLTASGNNVPSRWLCSLKPSLTFPSNPTVRV